MGKFFLSLILALGFCWSSFSCIALEKDIPFISSEYEITGNKIYINQDQLLFENQGIFIIIDGEQFQIQQLNCDENGIYCFVDQIDTITDQCANKHKIWCLRCGGCLVRYCKFRCKCVTW